MTDDALEAFQASDRPHSLGDDRYHRIEQIMLDAYQNAEVEVGGDGLTLAVDRPGEVGDRPNRSGRVFWLVAAAGLVVFGHVAARIAGDQGQTAPAGSEILGDYCQDSLEPMADALDLLRVNPSQANADEVHRLQGHALTQLQENRQITVDVNDLIEDHQSLQPSPETSDSLTGIANSLGQRVASLTESSPRCDLGRLAPSEDRLTDLLGRPITDD